MVYKKIILFLITCVLPQLAYALAFPLPPKGDSIVGQIQTTKAHAWDTFHNIGREFDLGYNAMNEANPHLDPKWPLPGKRVVVPSEFILPPGPMRGIVINLAAMRLYYYSPKTGQVITFPIGIGMLGWATPTGKMHVIQKIKNPSWVIPKSILVAAKKNGYDLPKKITHGPKDPLGDYALRLSDPTYLIHGTNKPPTVGMRSSSGCIRLFPEDIKALFAMVSKGTPVRIINTPYKAGWQDGKLYLEAHLPLKTQKGEEEINLTPMVQAVSAALKHHPDVKVDWQLATEIAMHPDGLPEVISVDTTTQNTVYANT